MASGDTLSSLSLRNPKTIIVLSILVVLSSIPGGVLAQGPDDHTIVLDSDPEKIQDVTVDGQIYQIYRYENLLPYASGIEVFRDGERVTSEEEARRVIRSAAWTRSLDRMDDEELGRLKETQQTVRRIDSTLTPIVDLLDAIIGFVDGMKENSVGGTSVWDLAVSTHPSLREFDSSVRQVRSDVGEVRRATERVSQNLRVVIREIEREKGEDQANYGELSASIEDSSAGFEQLRERALRVRDSLSEASDGAQAASNRVSGVPVVGGDLSNAFADMSNRLGEAASTMDDFASRLGSQHQRLNELNAYAESEERDMMAEWRSRQTAESRVYGTLGGVGLVSVLAGFLVFRRI